MSLSGTFFFDEINIFVAYRRFKPAYKACECRTNGFVCSFASADVLFLLRMSFWPHIWRQSSLWLSPFFRFRLYGLFQTGFSEKIHSGSDSDFINLAALSPYKYPNLVRMCFESMILNISATTLFENFWKRRQTWNSFIFGKDLLVLGQWQSNPFSLTLSVFILNILYDRTIILR